jgi:hypothetical protein
MNMKIRALFILFAVILLVASCDRNRGNRDINHSTLQNDSSRNAKAQETEKKKISKELYEKLVDYANCKYTAVYIEYFRGNKDEAKNIKEYDSNIKDKISNCDIDNPLKFDVLSELLKNNGWKWTDSVISAKINKLKDKYDENSTDNILIGRLKLDDNLITIYNKAKTKYNKPDDISKTINQLQRELKRKYLSPEPQGNENDNREPEPDNDGNGNSGTVIVVIIFVFALAGFICYRRRERIKKHFNSSQSYGAKETHDQYSQSEFENRQLIEELIKELRDLKTNDNIRNRQSEQKIGELEQRIRELEQRIVETTDSSQQTDAPVKDSPVLPDVDILYADAITNGVFHRVSEGPNEDTVFELRGTPSARKMQFSIYQGACKRVIKNPDFVDGCDKQRISAQPQNLEVEPGEAVQDDFGKWKIIRKAKIKFV